MKFIEVLGDLCNGGLSEYHEYKNLESAKSFCVDADPQDEKEEWFDVIIWIVNEDTGCNGSPYLFSSSTSQSHAEYIKNALLDAIGDPEVQLIRTIV